MGHLREVVENVLSADLDRTRESCEKALADFRAVTEGDFPSGIPYPDNVTRIRQAAQRHNHAMDAYRTALRRFNDYTIRGIIPDDDTFRDGICGTVLIGSRARTS